MTSRSAWALIVAAIVAGAAAAVVAQGRFDAVQIKTEKLADGVWVLVGAGGNIGVSAGADGVVLIDDQYAELSPKILAAVKTLSNQPVRWVVNTHWHGDHVGGNANMAKSGAAIIAHANVRRRMTEGQVSKLSNSRVDPAPAIALPIVTFNDSTTLHVNGEDLVVFHVASAHTDGDAIVWFRKANVVHMGDTFFNLMYPRIDVESGGSIDGMVAACDRVLPLLAADTRVIPGHGPVTNRGGLQSYRDMLDAIRGSIAKRIAADYTLEQVRADSTTAPYDAIWGKGFIKPGMLVQVIYEDLARKK